MERKKDKSREGLSSGSCEQTGSGDGVAHGPARGKPPDPPDVPGRCSGCGRHDGCRCHARGRSSLSSTSKE